MAKTTNVKWTREHLLIALNQKSCGISALWCVRFSSNAARTDTPGFFNSMTTGGAERSNTSSRARLGIHAGIPLGVALEDVLEEGGTLFFVERAGVGGGQAGVEHVFDRILHAGA